MSTERQSQGCICPKYQVLVLEVTRLQNEIDHLTSENARYRRDFGRMCATMLEKPFNLPMPSANQPVKASTPAPERCPCCSGELLAPPFGSVETREVISPPPARARVRRYNVHVKF